MKTRVFGSLFTLFVSGLPALQSAYAQTISVEMKTDYYDVEGSTLR